jgi:hypothetical protein
MPSFWNATPWRGFGNEDEMTEEDWQLRGTQQAMSMLNGLDSLDSTIDENGVPTGGCYNGDYPDSWHEECNRRLEEDEYYEAQAAQDIETLIAYLEDQ